MNATPRFRLFDSNRRGDVDPEEGAPQTLRRPRMITSVSIARARRRNRRRRGVTDRNPGLVPIILSLSRAASTNDRRRAILLLLVVVCVALTYSSTKFLFRASRSWELRPRTASLLPHTTSIPSSRDNGDSRRNQFSLHPSVSLGPDAIPSVVRVERGPGGARKASGLYPAIGHGMVEEDLDFPDHCRNTVQGTTLLADSEGRVCRRTDIDEAHRPGCCTERRPPRVFSEENGGHDGNEARVLGQTEGYVYGGVLASSATTVTAVSGGNKEKLVGFPAVVRMDVPATADGMQHLDNDENDGFPPEHALSARFSCWSCDEVGEGGRGNGTYSSCCRSYEFCVACCQAPWREKERETIREAAARAGHPVYRELGFHKTHQLRGTDEERKARYAAFDHCAFRCRTYSGTVAHENSYRSPLKHCFGRFRPPVVVDSGMSLTLPEWGGGVLDGRYEAVENQLGKRASTSLQLDPFLTNIMDAKVPSVEA